MLLNWLLDQMLSHISPVMWLIGIGVGLVVYFFSSIVVHIPQIAPYAKFVKPVAMITALVCTFMYGGAGVQQMWLEKIALAEQQAQIAEAKADQLNSDLKSERLKKANVRVEYRDRVKYEIREVASQIDAKCDVSPIAIEKVNKAAKNPDGGLIK